MRLKKENERKQKRQVLILRLPRALHATLKEHAAAEGVSLNQYCLYLLSRGVGDKSFGDKQL